MGPYPMQCTHCLYKNAKNLKDKLLATIKKNFSYFIHTTQKCNLMLFYANGFCCDIYWAVFATGSMTKRKNDIDCLWYVQFPVD